MKIHNVFHPNLLQKTLNNPLPRQYNASAPSVIVNDKKEWKVNDILDAKRIGGRKIGKKAAGKVEEKIQFCVKWKGYNENKKWYNASGFEHAKEVVNDFYNRHPTKPCQEL